MLKKARKIGKKYVIGRKESVCLKDFGLENLNAKIDTGAFTSCLHAHHFIELEQDGKKVLLFKLLDPSHPEYDEKELKTSDYSTVKVRSSSGHLQTRFKIKLKIKIGAKVYRTDFTLTNRRKMKHPILLGRKFLKKRFLVDVSQKNLFSKK